MKNIFKHIVIVYLSFFMLLASIAIPYSAMTCKISNTKSYAFLNAKFDCQLDETKACGEQSIEKDACCLFDNGIIDTDTELVVSTTYGFEAVLNYIEIPRIIPQSIDNFFYTHAPFVEVDLSEKPIRILQQSFLC